MISRLPEPEDTVRLWDYVTGPAGFPGFAELKRRALRRTRRFLIDRNDLRAAVRTVVNKTLDARAVEWRGPATSCASDSRKFGSLRTL